MPSLFSRAFSCSCTHDASRDPATRSSFPRTSSSSSSSSASTSNSISNSWLRRLGQSFNFSIGSRRWRKKKGRGTEQAAAIRHEPRHARLSGSGTRPSSNAASAFSSVPSLSRLDSTVSSASAASILGACSPAIRVHVDDTDVMRTLKGMQAAVPESPRISFHASLPPTLEGDDSLSSRSLSSRRPSYCVNVPQLYPYTLSADDIWAEEIVANILADYTRSARP